MADVIHKKDKGSSIMVVVSPLKSLMEDQVRALKKLNIPAVCVKPAAHESNLLS
jgi:superfamily II DNA helicase RecQ